MAIAKTVHGWISLVYAAYRKTPPMISLPARSTHFMPLFLLQQLVQERLEDLKLHDAGLRIGLALVLDEHGGSLAHLGVPALLQVFLDTGIQQIPLLLQELLDLLEVIGGNDLG